MASEKEEGFSLKYEPNAFGHVFKLLTTRRVASEIIIELASKDFDERFMWDERNEDQLAKDINNHDQVIKRGYMSYLNSDINQAIAELIVSNILSNYAVFIVLTDLNDEWLFYWLTNDKHVMMSRAETSHDALAIIERALVLNTKATTTVSTNFSIGMRCNYFRMSNFQHGEVFESETVLDSFLNRSKVQFEFEDEIANMKNMFDDMTEKEISYWKVKRALRFLENTPGIQLDKNYINMYS
ncbi:crinkler family protein [Gigaspora margarita]|uniref:Crinkler family protein n=1 Tax=Gigaspora margarita TaxID=4874 RepID=A0A8H3WWM4_GIGMA|nr:crinkler family protein [Gigaspora margarita]